MLKNCLLYPALLTAFTGCATTDDLRSRPPVASGETHTATNEFVGCVQERWINNGADRVNLIPTRERSTLTLSGQTGVELLLDVMPSTSGSNFRLYSRMILGEAKFISATEACR